MSMLIVLRVRSVIIVDVRCAALLLLDLISARPLLSIRRKRKNMRGQPTMCAHQHERRTKQYVLVTFVIVDSRFVRTTKLRSLIDKSQSMEKQQSSLSTLMSFVHLPISSSLIVL